MPTSMGWNAIMTNQLFFKGLQDFHGFPRLFAHKTGGLDSLVPYMCVWDMIAWSIVRALVAQPWLFRYQHGNLTRRKVWKGNWFHWCVLWSPLRWFFWIWWSLLSKSFWHVLVWMRWLQHTIHSLPKIITLLSLQDLILNTGWDYDGLSRLSTLLRDQRLGRE